MTALTRSQANASADWHKGSIINPYVLSEAATMLQAVYKKSDGTIALASSDVDEASAEAFGIICGVSNQYGETSVPAGATVSVCEWGPLYGFTGMTPGARAWVGSTPGEVVDTAPAGEYQYCLGESRSAIEFFVHPGLSAPVYS